MIEAHRQTGHRIYSGIQEIQHVLSSDDIVLSLEFTHIVVYHVKRNIEIGVLPDVNLELSDLLLVFITYREYRRMFEDGIDLLSDVVGGHHEQFGAEVDMASEILVEFLVISDIVVQVMSEDRISVRYLPLESR